MRKGQPLIEGQNGLISPIVSFSVLILITVMIGRLTYVY